MTRARLSGKATADVQPGEHVLCRGGVCQPAAPSIANGVASRPRFKDGWTAGDWLEAEPVEGLGERDLHAMASGPIMDPSRLYLPAGKISEDEWRRRIAQQMRDAGGD